MNKQIEELKRIIDERCEAELGQVHASSKGGKVTKTVDTSLIAKDIYNAGYQKIDKDKPVVLSREEYEKLKHNQMPLDPVVLTMKQYLDINHKAYFKSKETAREILQRLFEEHNAFNENDVIVVWQVKEVLTEIAKQYGVDLGEEQ